VHHVLCNNNGTTKGDITHLLHILTPPPPPTHTQAVAKRVMFDTGILLIASGTWYGAQHGLRALRGVDDAANVAVAGGLSAGFLGATCECHHVLDFYPLSL
jgi:heme/copper-type cytochrome/quinol oxidase subunit 3